MLHAEIDLALSQDAGAIMVHKAFTIAGEYERRVQRGGIIERLLHAVRCTEDALLGFDDSERDVLVVQHEVRLLRPATADQLAADDDTAFGEAHLPADMRCLIPTGIDDCRSDIFNADVVFAELVFIYRCHVHASTSCYRRLCLG